MSEIEVVEKLMNEAKTNPASSAVFHAFGLRHRTRNEVALSALYHKMRKEGFNFTKDEYLPVIKLLGNLGIGELDVSARGRIKGVKNLKSTLQSIGQIACGQRIMPQPFKSRRTMMTGTRRATRIVRKPKILSSQIKTSQTLESQMGLTLEVNLNGRLLHLPLPKNLNVQDLQVLIDRFRVA